MSDAVASVLEDSVLESVDSTVSNLKSAMKTKRKEKENRTPAVSKKKPSRKGTGSKGTVTPKHLPPRLAKTPMITPKFDTSRVMRSVSRAAKAGEVLVSLSGLVFGYRAVYVIFHALFVFKSTLACQPATQISFQAHLSPQQSR